MKEISYRVKYDTGFIINTSSEMFRKYFVAENKKERKNES